MVRLVAPQLGQRLERADSFALVRAKRNVAGVAAIVRSLVDSGGRAVPYNPFVRTPFSLFVFFFYTYFRISFFVLLLFNRSLLDAYAHGGIFFFAFNLKRNLDRTLKSNRWGMLEKTESRWHTICSLNRRDGREFVQRGYSHKCLPLRCG